MSDSDCGYVAFYAGKRVELRAPSLWAAVQKARELFKTPRSKQHLVNVVLAETSSGPVVHTAVD